ncbi:hypothetical protein LCGC14_1325570 [marine sediment metagenome]|uniref:Uncharacterized protein n=1 Tax=marine sediment metagenome TaxID=412755 RepID=A0A0F9KIC8_9ZZZZ
MGQSLDIPRVIKDDWKRLDLIIGKIKLKLGRGASPTFTSLTITGLTASRLIATDASKALESSDLVNWVAGTANQVVVADDSDGTITLSTPQDIHTGASPTFVGLTLSGLTATRLMATGSSKEAASVANLTSWIAGTTDHISVADDGDGTVTLNLDTNTRTLLGSFNGIFLEKLNFTISYSSPTVTGSLEQDGGGDLIQKFSDGYTTLDCTDPVLTIDLTTYVGTDAVPKEVFVYILQSDKTTIVASNTDWPATEHIKIANLLLKSAATTGSDGGALVNRNWNDYAFGSDSQGHITHIEDRIRQEPSQWNSGVALTLKNSAGAALTTGNSSTAVEIVTSVGTVYQLHKHTFPAFDMYTVGTDDAHVVNQPIDRGGAYETTADLVTDVTHYDDGSASGVAIGNNKYFNLVLWGVQNRSGEPSHVMINLPTGQYNNEANAISDVDGTSVFDIPALFKGMGFLIARLTFKLSTSGPEWTYIAQEDLRGQIPPISAGVSVTTTDHALLANLTFALAGHTGFQAQGDVLDDLNTLGAVGADSEFLVGTGAGALAWENAATARTSLGVGTGDSPIFAGTTIFSPMPILVFKDSNSVGDASVGFLEWRDSNNTRLGFFGNSSSGNDDLLWKNESSGGHISIETTGAGEVKILANTVVSGTITLPLANEINFRDSDISIGSTVDGFLDITADTEVDFFYNNADVGDAVDGQSLYINRRAAEGDDYIRLYIDNARKGLIGFSGADDLLQLVAAGLTVNGTINTTGVYKVDDTQVLSGTTLGANVVNSSLTSVGTIATGTWQGTTIAINQGGTGQTTAQAAIDALSAVSGATNEHVLTKDTATGNAVFKTSTAGTTFISLTDTPANYTGDAGKYAKVNAGEDGLEFDTPAGGGGAGGGTARIFVWSPDSVTQGTWSIGMAVVHIYGGYIINLTGVANGDEIHFSTYLGAGTYTLKMMKQHSNSTGIVDIYIDAAEVASFDTYSSSPSYNNVSTQTGIVVGAGGVKDIKVIVDGKNASSSNYYAVIQDMVFYRTA